MQGIEIFEEEAYSVYRSILFSNIVEGDVKRSGHTRKKEKNGSEIKHIQVNLKASAPTILVVTRQEG